MIRTRFSPSPTGLIHLGNARAALFSALFARKMQGAFILRIEDTDAARSDQRYTDALIDDLNWLGVSWQEGPVAGGPHQPYWQSQRHDIYDHYYRQLDQKGLVYPCFCSDQELALNRKIQLSRGQAPRYPGTCKKLSAEEIAKRLADGKKPALRFKVPTNVIIGFVDLVKGQQNFNSDDIGDFIIRRAEGTASFMFCNAIDDSLMEVTHVLRGDDHLTNTPRQLMILDALRLRTPQYGHLSTILGSDGTRLSKRHGSFSVSDLREHGYLPRAVVNYLARLSHNYDHPELLSFDELADKFAFEKLSRAPARFDTHQLLHWQKEAVMALSIDDTWTWLGDELKSKVPTSARELFADVMRKNIHFPNEARKWETILFENQLNFTPDQVDVLQEAGESFFDALQNATQKHGTDLKPIFDDMKSALNVTGKKLFMPVRIALTGEQHGPELIQISALLGADKMQQRFKQAMSVARK